MATTVIKSSDSDNQALVDSSGHLYVTTSGSGGTADINLIEVGGSPITLGPATIANSLPVTDPSIGPTGATAPIDATLVGAVDSGGKLQPLTVDPSGKLLVDISGSSTVTGTVNANILGLNVFQTSQYTVGTSAVQLTPTPLTNRSSMSVKATCTGANAIYIGTSNAVTTSTGFPLFNGDVLNLDLTPSSVVWAIASAASQTAYVLELAE